VPPLRKAELRCGMLARGALSVTTSGPTKMLKSSAGSSDLTTALLRQTAEHSMAQEVVQSITTMWHALAPKTLWLLALRFRAAITVPTARMLVSTVDHKCGS